MTEHRAVIEPYGEGCRAACACGWAGKQRFGSDGAELAIHDAEQHDRYAADVARLTAD